MTRVQISSSGECLDSRFAGSFKQGAAAIAKWAGIPVVVLAPYGGDRTAAQQHIINPGTVFSDHLLTSANIGRAAADVDNWRQLIIAGARAHGLTYEQAKAEYYAIWALLGWINQTTTGQPFPAEGWHIAKHHPDTAAETASAVLHTITKAPTKEEDTMLLHSNAVAKEVPANYPRYAVSDGLTQFRFLDNTGTPKQVSARLTRERKAQREVVLSRGEYLAMFNDVQANRAAQDLPPLPKPAALV